MLRNLIMMSFVLLLSGCSWSNPFGIGHEKSACDMSSGFGVCGDPKVIYQHRDIIKNTQDEYMKSGYEEDVFFSINSSGEMLAKSGRDDSWSLYKGSKIEKEIKKRLDKKNPQPKSKNVTEINPVNLKQDVPITIENDLSIRYQQRAFLLETRTDVGELIRDNGLIQKIWIAPVVDSKKDLIAAHHIYVVIKDPSWKIGENTPKKVKKDDLSVIPTPMSKEILDSITKTNNENDMIVNLYNSDEKDALDKIIKKDIIKDKVIDDDTKIINQFLEEK